jgi:hypothetical protein
VPGAFSIDAQEFSKKKSLWERHQINPNHPNVSVRDWIRHKVETHAFGVAQL